MVESFTVFSLIFALLAPVGGGVETVRLPTADLHRLAGVESGAPLPFVRAESWLIADADTGRILAGDNFREPRPIASIVKLVTALTAWEIYRDWDVVASVPGWIWKIGGSSAGLFAGQTVSFGELLDKMMVKSGNDAAFAMAAFDKNFVEKMNKVARLHGAETAIFKNPAGFDDGTVASARDVMQIMRAVLERPRIVEAMQKSQIRLGDGLRYQNTNRLHKTYLRAQMIGGKTGTTPMSGECLVTAFELIRADRTLKNERNPRIIVVVLGSRDRFADTKAIVEWAERFTKW